MTAYLRGKGEFGRRQEEKDVPSTKVQHGFRPLGHGGPPAFRAARRRFREEQTKRPTRWAHSRFLLQLSKQSAKTARALPPGPGSSVGASAATFVQVEIHLHNFQ